jgi:hypothetical protein
MTQKTFVLIRWMLMFAAIVLTLTLVFFLELYL